MAGEDEVAEAGREALDLRLDPLDVRVELGAPIDPALRAVRVGPGGVLARGRARRVGERLLTEQQERPLGQPVLAAPRSLAHQLVLAAGDVDGAGAARGSGASHGIGPSSAQSTLTVAGP